MIHTLLHPEYTANAIDCLKYRYIMEGGTEFIEKYLIKFSERETDSDFLNRKLIAPIPSFTKGAIIDVKNAIFQRMSEISRTGGSESYTEAVAGTGGGVDREGSTMNHFIGRKVLPELLFMGKIGVWVDMPQLDQRPTKAQTKLVRPYFYTFKREQIRNWTIRYIDNFVVFDKLLLEEYVYSDKSNICSKCGKIKNDHDQMTNHAFESINNIYGLPTGVESRYRYCYHEDNVVKIKFFNNVGTQIDLNNDETEEEYILDLPRIPFVLFELDQPLTADIANHQLTLLNLESSDVSYALKSNFPFYTEQRSNTIESDHLQKQGDTAEGENISVGAIQGRKYAKGVERPGFISPSSEPLNASMEKQKALKEDIRMLVNLALSNVRSKFASAESKEMDERGLESGLSAIGLILEHGERQLAELFNLYEKDKKIATIHYPQRYSLKTDSQRLKEAESLGEQKSTIPSKKFQKEISKEIARILLKEKVSSEDFNIILAEIDSADYIGGKAEDIHADLEHGIVSLETAAVVRGYNKDEVKKAEEDHAKRLARIAESQTKDAGARGVPDLDSNADSAKLEKEKSQNPDLNETGKKQVRGEANG